MCIHTSGLLVGGVNELAASSPATPGTMGTAAENGRTGTAPGNTGAPAAVPETAPATGGLVRFDGGIILRGNTFGTGSFSRILYTRCIV